MLARTLGVAVALTLAGPAAASAERAVGLIDKTSLLRFDTTAPTSGTSVALTGLTTTTETVIGIDWRPATGELIGVTVPTGSLNNQMARTYSIDPQTGVATLIGTWAFGVPGLADLPGDIDFNPRVDRYRIVESSNENARGNPVNGSLSGIDADLTYTAPATGPITALALDRDVAPGPPGTLPPVTQLTTAYGIDSGSSRLVLIGSVDGVISPNSGAVTAVGQLGVGSIAGTDAGLDISPSGVAYASLRVAGRSALYTVNLTTGAATLIGALPAEVRSLTILPPDNCPAITGDDQSDLDGDGLGDACDPDIDGDGVTNAAEAARGSDPRNADSDGDGKPDSIDGCPLVAARTDTGCLAPALVTPAIADRTAPTVTVDRLASKAKLKAFLKGVSLRVKADEPASFEVTMFASTSKATIAKSFNLTLASKSLARAAGTRTLTLKPSKKLVGKARRFSVTVQVVGIDAAGNRRTVRKTITVRP